MRSSLLFFSLCLFAVAACTPYYVNTEDLGTRATAEEIKAHYSGNSIRFSSVSVGGEVNVEAYYGADGTYKMVRLDKPSSSIGTWRMSSGLGGDGLALEFKNYNLTGSKV